MRILPIFMIAGALTVAACAGKSDIPLSPRENAYNIAQVYAAVLVSADEATSLELTPGKPVLSSDVKLKIATSSQTATNGMKAYLSQAANCFRDPITNKVGNAPGKICDQSAVSAALSFAEGAATNASQLLAQFGYTPSTGATPKFAE